MDPLLGAAILDGTPWLDVGGQALQWMSTTMASAVRVPVPRTLARRRLCVVAAASSSRHRTVGFARECTSGGRCQRRIYDRPARSRPRPPVGSMPPGPRPRAPKDQRCQGMPSRGPGSMGTPRRSSGRADLISGKPRRRTATASSTVPPSQHAANEKAPRWPAQLPGRHAAVAPSALKSPAANTRPSASSRASAGRCRRGPTCTPTVCHRRSSPAGPRHVRERHPQRADHGVVEQQRVGQRAHQGGLLERSLESSRRDGSRWSAA